MYEFKLVGVSKFENRCESECEWSSLCVNTVTDSGPQAAQHGKHISGVEIRNPLNAVISHQFLLLHPQI